MKTRAIDVTGFPPFLIPAEPEEISGHSEVCARAVLEGEYAYSRDRPENVRSVIDVGCNLGQFAVWATRWWPGVKRILCYDPNEQALDIANNNILLVAPPIPDGVDWDLYCGAVTVEPHPFFRETDEAGRLNWGGSRTYLQTSGKPVTSLHPRDLPRADALKTDCEGCDLEVLENYPFMSELQVCMFEWHEVEHREPMREICQAAGLRLVKEDNGVQWGQGVNVWVRP